MVEKMTSPLMQPAFNPSAPASGQYVAWTMDDGNVMAGTLHQCWADCFYVKRVDGTILRLPRDKARPATIDDVEAACRFFARQSLDELGVDY